MTLAEFKAWLDGYGMSFKGAPTEDQWKAIKAKLASVHEAAPVISPYYPGPILNPPLGPSVYPPNDIAPRRFDDLSPRPVPIWYGDVTCKTIS